MEADAPILPVSSHTREGLDALTAVLDDAAGTSARAGASRSGGGRFRLAVDRRFSLAGAGTVVWGAATRPGAAVSMQASQIACATWPDAGAPSSCAQIGGNVPSGSA